MQFYFCENGQTEASLITTGLATATTYLIYCQYESQLVQQLIGKLQLVGATEKDSNDG